MSYNNYDNLQSRHRVRSFLSEPILNNMVAIGEKLTFTIITIEKWKIQLVYVTGVTARLTYPHFISLVWTNC